MLVAYADESDAGNMKEGIFTVSGYVAFPTQWGSFSEEWSSVIENDPVFKNVGYFKSSALHSNAWRKEHRVTKGDANRVHAKLIPIIQNQPILFSAITTLRCEDWDNVIRHSPLGDAEWVRNPYYFCYHAFCAITLRHVHALGIAGDHVNFVFDNKDVISDRANELFGWIRDVSDLDATIKNLMGVAEPGIDSRLPPLQAADILASRVMHHCMKPSSRKLYASLFSISGSGDNNITTHLKRSHFEKFLSGFSDFEAGSLPSEL